ncbi:MAG: PAS domain S-box-containing protein, partial [Gammaproteobacteria bacterium]
MVSHSKTGPDQGRTNDLKSSPSSHVAEDEAKYAFGRFNDVVTIAADWFWEMDQKLRFTYQSSRFEEITGIPANNVLGKNREEAFKGLIDDTEKWARLGASLTEHTDYSMIWAIKHPDGKTRVLHTRGKPVFNAEDNFIGYRGVGSDITDSIEIMQALEISELRFRDFAEVGADWFFELDEALKLSWLSDDWHRPSGLAASDLLGKDEKVIPVEWFESETKWQHHQECLDKKIPFSSEYRWVSTDGKVMHIQTTGKPVFDEEGGFVGYRCASTDITERKSAEQFTLARERRFRTVIENVTDIVSLADEQGNITFLNSSAERIFGFDKDSQLPVKVGMFSCEDDREAIAKAHQNAIKNPGMIFKQTYRGTHRDGSIRVIETTRQRIVNIESEDNLLVVIHSRDITEQFLTDRALQDSEQRLRDFAETGADWFWEQDEKFRFTYVSGALPDLELFSNNNLIGKTRHELSREFSFKSDNWQQLARIYKKRESFNNFEYQIKRQNSQTVVVRINGKPIYDERGRFLGYRGTGVDVTESFFLAKMVSYQATHDSLTGLVNRREFEHRMTRLIEKSQNSNFSHALCYIDLDQFKVINDTCGHEAGDA